MKQKKNVKIDETNYVVQELTVREIIDFFESTEEEMKKPELAAEPEEGQEAPDLKTSSTDFFKQQIQQFIDLAFDEARSIDEFIDMAPSDIEKLWDAFQDANSVFFRIAHTMGMGNAVLQFVNEVLSNFSGVLATSSNVGIQKSLTTDTPTS